MDGDSATAQSRIDALAYPPTHQYDITHLRPSGPLSARVHIIMTLCPSFFAPNVRFLDVGASKGFFSLRAARNGAQVLAVDPDDTALAAWAEQMPKNCQQLHGSFKDLDPTIHGRFDTVWVGNGPHYLYREDQNYLKRLARLARDRVLMEGPVGRACRDVFDWTQVQEESDLISGMRGYGFILQGRADSPAYTPDRAIWYFRKTR